ncbi:glycosyltransferase [Flammeovirga yaeyamensis]|uniref:Glycosyltransferase n=1 Tax=Flammeovirga yaeyamensis TaxID=367791 RepID=A0AAX1N533_9BACT|nr:glycosyltransferase family 2 protein [Flammeovirga yaeyamensis]MBB3701318.1 glycosyltransferase involved in cell wall biosynthesis [Flammeovirga yaeyamensis]NMF38213.1 glycosyltransferase family 2 protein [Flammeovirga yaeyamensis]QWG02626.1 glycosyltransferase [Flammeovirga yaeyamensis]
MTKKVSIITAVYNAEAYLERYFDSILNQTYKNLEIICIDDASTDNSATIIENHQKDDARIKLIRAEHQGYTCRNIGFDACTGDYFTIVDHDDWLGKDAIEKALRLFETEDIQASLYQLNYFFSEENNSILPLPQKRIFTNLEALDLSMDWKISAFGVYNAKLLPHAFTTSTKFFADEVQSRVLFHKCEKVGISDGVYFYLQNDLSISRTISVRSLEKLDTHLLLKDYLIDNKLYDAFSKKFQLQHIKIWIGLLNRFLKEDTSKINENEFIRSLKQKRPSVSLYEVLSSKFSFNEKKYLAFMLIPFGIQFKILS